MHVSLCLFICVLVSACSKPKPAPEADESPPAAAAPAPAASSGPNVAKAKEIFVQRCVACHGATGQGDGPASASLNPKPRKFADPAWQKEVTDDYLEKIVKFGGAGVGKSPAMPSNPDLNDPQVIAGLRTVIRSFNTN